MECAHPAAASNLPVR